MFLIIVLIFLGIEIDIVKCEVRLLEDKFILLKEVFSCFMCKCIVIL